MQGILLAYSVTIMHGLEKTKTQFQATLLIGGVKLSGRIKANSHMPCRARAVSLPCCAALIYTYHAVPLQFSDSAVSFVKIRAVAGNIRTASPTV
jgi:hypothetical protein